MANTTPGKSNVQKNLLFGLVWALISMAIIEHGVSTRCAKKESHYLD